MKKISLYVFIILIFLNLVNILKASEIIKYPLPEITNYPPSANGGYTATWGITQGKDGKIYFANSYGVLIYDGKQWRSVLLDSKYPARSIDVDQSGNILVGGKGDFGFISNDGKGNPKFTSLKNFLDKEYKSTDIIYETFSLDNNELFFRTNNKLLFYKNKKITTIDKVNKKKFGVSRYLNKKLYISITGLGIAILENKKIILISNSEIFNNKSISGFHLSEEDDLIVFTRKSGVYIKIKNEFVKIENDLIDNISAIYRTYNLKNNKIGLATYEGFYIFNKNFEPLIHLDSNSGLRVDNVRSIFEDNNGNIWLGLDDGIVKININSVFKYLPIKETNLNSKILSVELFNNNLYVGTSTNIKKLVIDNDFKLKQKFVNVAKTKINTQVWSIYNSGTNLLVGSNSGFGQIDINDNYEQLIDYKVTGRVYQIIESKIFNNYIYIRAKKGIFLINKEYSTKYEILYNGKSASHIQELVNKNEIWFEVTKKGVHRINLVSENIEQLNHSEIKVYDNNYLKNEKIKIFKIYDELIFKTEDNIFQFDEKNKSFYISNIFNPVPNIKEKNILKVKKTNKETYWINFTERKDGRRVQEFYELNSSLDIKKLPFSQLSHHLAIKFFFVENLTLMSSNEGIVIIDSSSRQPNRQSAVISSIRNNNIYIHNFGPKKDLLDNEFKIKNLFKYNKNKFSFTVSLTDFKNENINQFRYRLDGFENKYSKFSKNEIVTYTNLKPGEYNFYVEAINSEGIISEPSSYTFTIQYPWWQSKTFYISEILFFLILLSVTLFLKKSGKATFVATSITFMMILVLFEYVNFVVDPLIASYSKNIPIFSILSKVILGIILLPLERLINKILDRISKKISFLSSKTIKN